MQWDETAHGLGVAEMDATHREFLALVNALLKAPAIAFRDLFERLRTHTRAHFEREFVLMQASGFAATAEHEAEHARVLADLTHLAVRVQQGNLVLARAYAQSLPEWFGHHVATMDSALAARIKDRVTERI